MTVPKVKPEDMARTRIHDEVDGRRRRSLSSRAKIIDAMIELIREGDLVPSADAVADRAGVGRRTVFRVFKDMEGIFHEIQKNVQGNLPALRTGWSEGDNFEEKLQALIARRAELFEEVMMLAAAALVHRHGSELLQDGHAKVHQEFRANLLAILPPERRADAEFCEMMDACLSLDTWNRLRLDQKQDFESSRSIFQRIAKAMVTA